MKQRKNLKIVLVIIGMVLIFSVINSIYNINKINKHYETTDAICIRENKIYNEGATYYQREYVYTISGQEYILNTFEANSRAYKTIKYNPNNPNEARTYEGINAETIIIFCIGLIFVCSPFILNIANTENNEKLHEIKYKFLRMSKRNIIKTITVCFWGAMLLSLIFALKEVFFAPDWGQVVVQYSQAEIIIECITFIVGRCNFKKFTTYFNIFRT